MESRKNSTEKGKKKSV